MNEIIKVEDKNPQEYFNELKELKLVAASLNTLYNQSYNPWSSDEIDRMEINTKDFSKTVEACRFFYEKDPIASSTINKMVEIGINDLIFKNNGLTENEMRIFYGIKNSLLDFAETMAMEYLISGLVVPEIIYAPVEKQKLQRLGIKKYDVLTMPITLWLRNPEDIVIKETLAKPSFFYKVPGDIRFFIKNKGKYPDGSKDDALWEQLTTYYPEFVRDVTNNVTEFLLNNDLIFRRKPKSNNPYPTPFLSAALEALKHKRNLRRMDYSIASRVIGAIQVFKLGNDTFPVTQDDSEEQFGAIKNQMLWRDGTGKDVERIFQLFANHTLEINWVFPPVDALLSEKKYDNINQDIIYSLGFPRILITGETEKTGTSDPQYAMMSPARTMENFRNKIITVIKDITYRVAEDNRLKSVPEVKFKPLRLFDYQTLLKSLADLYNSGNISRTTYADELGYSWEDEMVERENENNVLKTRKLQEFAPKPFSNQPDDVEINQKTGE